MDVEGFFMGDWQKNACNLGGSVISYHGDKGWSSGAALPIGRKSHIKAAMNTCILGGKASMDLIKELTKSQLKEAVSVTVGDTVRVHVKVKEG